MNLSPVEIGVLMIVLFFILMYLKMPIGVALLIPGFLGFWLIRDMPAALSGLGIISFRQGLKEILLLIPLFTFMGFLAGAGGITRDAFSSLNKWVGHLPGGMAMATMGACAAFSALSGNSLAAALAMSAVCLPEMRKFGYRDDFTIACIAAGGNLDIMIPPSGAFVFYGLLTETSIGSLLMAGILPGLIITVMFMIQIYVQCRLNPNLGPQGPRYGWLERLKSLKGLLWIFLVFCLTMGGIYAGVFTPNEGAACGVFFVFLVGLINNQLKQKAFVSAIRETMTITALVMLMIIGSMYFGAFIAITKIPSAVAAFITELAINRYLVMFVILFIYLILGALMDTYPILAVTLPIFFPLVRDLGFDPLQFGVLCILEIMLGAICPPVGELVFALQGMHKEVPIWAIYRQCLPFIYSQIGILVLLVFIPEISTLLPNYMFSYR